jgi:hypothetical protein
MQLLPRQDSRVLVEFEARRPGLLTYRGYDVYYTQGGTLYRQYIRIGYTAKVKVGARPSKPETWETPCLSLTHLLPS